MQCRVVLELTAQHCFTLHSASLSVLGSHIVPPYFDLQGDHNHAMPGGAGARSCGSRQMRPPKPPRMDQAALYMVR
jgi:hypothetical protein